MRLYGRTMVGMAAVAALLVPTPALGATGARQLLGATPVGDLNADGSDDVVVFTSITDDELGNGHVAAAAHSGRDGAVLWSVDIPGMADVAPDGRGGVFLWTYQGTFTGGVTSPTAGEHPAEPVCCTGIGQLSTTLQGIDGDGTVRFTKVYDGSYAYTGTQVRAADAMTMVRGVVAGPNGAEAVVASYERTPGATAHDGAVTVSLVDREANERAVATERLDGALSNVVPTPDLDGDGADDVAILVEPPNETGAVVAYSTAAGKTEPLWRTTTETNWGRPPTSLGDVDGDGTSDLLVDADGGYGGLSTTTATNQELTILSGATGTARVVSAGDVKPVGDITGNGAVDLLAVAVYRSAQEVILEATLLEGSTLRQKGVRELSGPVEGSTATQVGAVDMGDLDGDGSRDVELQLATSDGVLRAVVSGRNLDLMAAPAGAVPLGASTDGVGDDLYTTAPHGQRDMVLSVHDAATGTTRWSQEIRAAGPSRVRANVQTADLSGDRRADLLVHSTSTGCQVVTMVVDHGCTNSGHVSVYDGATGGLAWQLSDRT